MKEYELKLQSDKLSIHTTLCSSSARTTRNVVWRLKGLVRLVAVMLMLTSHHLDAAEQNRPNFIFIFADDLGYGDLHSYGHPYAITDNLDRLAREGTSFRDFHVAGYVCPTSRAGLMTSRSPAWFPNWTEDYGFNGTQTVTKLIHDAGYLIGHIGKWNIGPNPTGSQYEDYGIDDLRLVESKWGDLRGREGLRFDEAIDFVEQNKDVPFYLNLWIRATHTPINPPNELVQRFNDLVVDRDLFGFHMQDNFDKIEQVGGNITLAMQKYVAEVYGIDLNVGRLLDKLEELGLSNNTVVVFTSDNGPANGGPWNAGWAGGLRGGKHSFYEGGVRVPFIIRWPGHVPSNKVNDKSFFSALDWLPTVCSIAGADIPWDFIEGEDVTDIWKGCERSRQNPLLYRSPVRTAPRYKVVMRYGRWKFFNREKELYDLDTDPEERYNVYNDFNDSIVATLQESVQEWENTLPTAYAHLPDDPLPFDPTVPAQVIGPPDLIGYTQGASSCATTDLPSMNPSVSPSQTRSDSSWSSHNLPSTNPSVSPSSSPSDSSWSLNSLRSMNPTLSQSASPTDPPSGLLPEPVGLIGEENSAASSSFGRSPLFLVIVLSVWYV